MILVEQAQQRRDLRISQVAFLSICSFSRQTTHPERNKKMLCDSHIPTSAVCMGTNAACDFVGLLFPT
jgi:hypothetical protein